MPGFLPARGGGGRHHPQMLWHGSVAFQCPCVWYKETVWVTVRVKDRERALCPLTRNKDSFSALLRLHSMTSTR